MKKFFTFFIAISLTMLVGGAMQPAIALVTIPGGATIDSATLFLYGSNTKPLNVHQVNEEWTETGVTWNTKPDYNTNIIDTFVTDGTGWRSANVTGLVQAWLDGVPNYGFYLEQGSSSYSTYRSSNHSDISTRPMLEISYYTTDPADITTVTIQRSGSEQDDVADAYIWELNPNSNGGTSSTLYVGMYGELLKESLIQFNFDTIIEEKSSLGEFVWRDLNRNGILDAQEPGIGGVVVNLYTCAQVSSPVTTTTTDSNGSYLFENLPADNYFVAFELPSGYTFSPDNQGGDDAADSDADPSTGETECIDLGPDKIDMTWDAGLIPEPACGDGTQDPYEECDDGNIVDGDGCSAACTIEPYCGDGNLDPNEGCDDGNNIDGDGCSAACTIEPYCGDGNLDTNEGCDDGNTVNGDGCSANCTIEAYCGDGNVDSGETCDDGNTVDGDGCSSTCTIEPYCGNGNLETNEGCDDGNTVDGDGCSSTCTIEPYCGDGKLNKGIGETCDDGNNIDGDGCSDTCTIEPYCGDGNLDTNEGCDDGNTFNDDGCSANCSIESYCGDGYLDKGETCDDGNNKNGDGCSAHCAIESYCGDGKVNKGETCDDGNTKNGDGCSSCCKFEIVAPKEVATIYKDPHCTGGDGGTFDFNGRSRNVFCLLSDKNLNLNARFGSANQKDKTRTIIAISKLRTDNGAKIKFTNNGIATLNGKRLPFGKEITLKKGTRLKYVNLKNKANPNRYLQFFKIDPKKQKALALLKIWTIEGYFIEHVAVQGPTNRHLDIGIRTSKKGVFTDGRLPDGLLGQTFDKNKRPMTAKNIDGWDFKVRNLDTIF